MRLLIAGGGTGGHLFPALAVARGFRAEEPRGAVLLVGRAGGPEERLVPEAGFELETVRVRGLDRDAPWKNLALPVLIPLALRAGLRIVDRFRPDVVLGMGGYVMAPAVAAARMRRIPYVLHEKDRRPGGEPRRRWHHRGSDRGWPAHDPCPRHVRWRSPGRERKGDGRGRRRDPDLR